MIKALVVDDEALLCELFDDMLTEMGYDIEVAMSADEALETLRKTQFDVVGRVRVNGCSYRSDEAGSRRFHYETGGAGFARYSHP